MSANRASFTAHFPTKAMAALRGCLEAVTGTAHRRNSHASRLELLAQPMHVDLDRIAAYLLAPLAQVLHQLILVDESARPLQEELQQAQFARRKIDALAAELRYAPDLIEGERPVL